MQNLFVCVSVLSLLGIGVFSNFNTSFENMKQVLGKNERSTIEENGFHSALL